MNPNDRNITPWRQWLQESHKGNRESTVKLTTVRTNESLVWPGLWYFSCRLLSGSVRRVFDVYWGLNHHGISADKGLSQCPMSMASHPATAGPVLANSGFQSAIQRSYLSGKLVIQYNSWYLQDLFPLHLQ